LRKAQVNKDVLAPRLKEGKKQRAHGYFPENKHGVFMPIRKGCVREGKNRYIISLL